MKLSKMNIEKFKPPKLKPQFRLLLYLASLISGVLSMMILFIGIYMTATSVRKKRKILLAQNIQEL